MAPANDVTHGGSVQHRPTKNSGLPWGRPWGWSVDAVTARPTRYRPPAICASQVCVVAVLAFEAELGIIALANGARRDLPVFTAAGSGREG